MEDLIRYILENIVDHTEDIEIYTEESDYGMNRINIRVNPEDMGKVIGKQGRTISSIRNIAKVKAIKTGVRVYINLIDDEKNQNNQFID